MRGNFARVMLIGLIVPAAFADDAGFAGQWMLQIPAPGVVPYAGLLELEQRGDEWVAYVENGPAPVSIDGKKTKSETYKILAILNDP